MTKTGRPVCYKCPKCGSSAFHVKIFAGKYVLTCWSKTCEVRREFEFVSPRYNLAKQIVAVVQNEIGHTEKAIGIVEDMLYKTS